MSFQDWCTVVDLQQMSCDNSIDSSISQGLSKPSFSKYKKRNYFYPVHTRTKAIEVFQKTVEDKLRTLHEKVTKKRHYISFNLTHKERLALQKLENNANITIRPSDKGGNVVVLNTDDYVTEAIRQLSDNEVYIKLKENPTSSYRKELFKIIQVLKHNNIVDIEISENLIPQHPVTPIFHMFPKIHKSMDSPPGRPIIAGIDSLNEPLSKLIDTFLQPLVKQLPSYIQDTTALLNKLKQTKWKATYKFCAVDVSSLYTSISHIKGMMAMDNMFDLFGKFEPIVKHFLLMGEVNSMSIKFLDLEITGDNVTGEINTTLYRKATSGNTTLEYNSCHPRHVIKGIPKGEYIRAKRNCSTEELYQEQAQIITTRLIERGYKADLLKKIKHEAVELVIITDFPIYRGRDSTTLSMEVTKADVFKLLSEFEQSICERIDGFVSKLRDTRMEMARLATGASTGPNDQRKEVQPSEQANEDEVIDEAQHSYSESTSPASAYTVGGAADIWQEAGGSLSVAAVITELSEDHISRQPISPAQIRFGCLKIKILSLFLEEKRLCSEENYFSVVIAKEKNIIWNGMNLPNDHYVARRLRIAKGSNFCISGSKQKYCFDEQNTIKSEELFTPRNKNLRSHRMLLVGGAGVGKTCLCKWLLKKWASGGELSYTCVLYLSLKQCDKKQISVKDLLDQKCKAASAILQNNPRDLLLILDDIDGLYCDEDKTSDSADDINTSLELKSLVTKIITKRFLPDTDVLIVSCVESMSKLQKHCSLSFIIQDFSDEETMNYCNTIAAKHKEAEYIIEKIKQTELSYFTKMPLQMCIVINFLNSQYSKKNNLNTFYTASGVLIYQLQQCLKKIKKKQFTEVELKKISELCFDNLIRSEKIKGNLYENVLIKTWHSNMSISDRCNKCIEYQHELLRDMLAAVHCSWEIQSGEDVKEFLNTWICGYGANGNTINKLLQPLVDEHHARFNNFTRFLMGLLHYPDYDSLVNNCPMMKNNIRESLVDWFRSKINLENQDLLKLFHCLFELHDEQVTSTVSDRLKTINLCNIPLSALDIQALKYCLENSILEETDLRLCGLRDEDVAQLQNIMKNTKCIRIGGNHLTEISGLILSKVLMDSNCVIEKLALGNNTLGTSGVEALLEALEHNTTLQHLYLYFNGIGGNSIKQMLMSLEKNNTLKELV
ncbi:uncharacterized protein LOC128664315 [Bombina bombina]|uniref:uncharacterized protein LOC128664315 n=1 Tax=Bombina bombina TaxID=8345 RepID=UPI00235B2A82|nr:uncharacterized protein LOC128664315 [Bombina bombina]